MKLPQTKTLRSPDGRRYAAYVLATEDLRPVGLSNKRAVYRVVRTVRTRRGLGTIIHTLTTFTANRKVAAGLIERWIQKPVPGKQ